jgi:hypothetical protein
MRLDPKSGAQFVVTNGITNYAGAVDMVVDLGYGFEHAQPYRLEATPYDCSDMTGFDNQVINPGLHPLKGYWMLIYNGGVSSRIWNRLSWIASTNGCAIEAFVRASNDRLSLSNKRFIAVTNSAAFQTNVSGWYVELRFGMTRDGTNNWPVLSGVALQ